MDTKVNNLKCIYQNVKKINPNIGKINYLEIIENFKHLDSIFCKTVCIFNKKKLNQNQKINLLNKYLIDPDGKKLFSKKTIKSILDRYNKSVLFAYKSFLKKNKNYNNYKKNKKNMKGGGVPKCKIDTNEIQNIFDSKLNSFLQILDNKNLTKDYVLNNLDLFQNIFNLFKGDEIPELKIDVHNPKLTDLLPKLPNGEIDFTKLGDFFMFPLYYSEQLPFIGDFTTFNLDVSSIITSYSALIMKISGPYIMMSLDLATSLASGIPYLGTFAAIFDSFMVLGKIPVENALVHGLDYFNLYVQIQRKNWGEAYLLMLEIFPFMLPLLNNILDNADILMDYIGTLENLIMIVSDMSIVAKKFPKLIPQIEIDLPDSFKNIDFNINKNGLASISKLTEIKLDQIPNITLDFSEYLDIPNLKLSFKNYDEWIKNISIILTQMIPKIPKLFLKQLNFHKLLEFMISNKEQFLFLQDDERYQIFIQIYKYFLLFKSIFSSLTPNIISTISCDDFIHQQNFIKSMAGGYQYSGKIKINTDLADKVQQYSDAFYKKSSDQKNFFEIVSLHNKILESFDEPLFDDNPFFLHLSCWHKSSIKCDSSSDCNFSIFDIFIPPKPSIPSFSNQFINPPTYLLNNFGNKLLLPDFSKDYLIHKEYVRRDLFKEHPDIFHVMKKLILLHNYSIQADTDPLNKDKFENYGFFFGKNSNFGRKSQSPIQFLCKFDKIKTKFINQFIPQ